METRKIMRQEVADVIKSAQGGTIAYISYKTLVKGLKKTFGCDPIKVCTRKVQIGVSYANAVNNRLERQGDERSLESEGRKWGVCADDRITTHNDKTYLHFVAQRGGKYEVTYYLNGIEAMGSDWDIIHNKDVANHAPSQRQAEAGLEENQVKVFDLKLENLISITTGSIKYEVID